TYPDQSLYPANSAPAVVRRLNNALLRADQIDWAEGRNGTYWLAPILADAEAGFGGPLNAYELMRAMIDAGAAGVHYEDQLASEPYADLVWFETSTPDLGEAREFAEAIHERFPGKPLAYNCSPSFNWRKHLDDDGIASFQDTLGDWGYRFLFITLAGFHSLNAAMFELAHGYAEEQMPAYVRLQQREFELEEFGYTATRHQH